MNTDILAILKAEISAAAKTRDIDSGTSITRDLGLGSLAIMDFMMVLEDRFDVSIPMDMIVDVETVGELARVIGILLEKQTVA